MNTVTSFIDGSPIYGSEKKLTNKLRRKSGGKMKEGKRGSCSKGFLPEVDDKIAVCDSRNTSDPCYLAGNMTMT